MVSFKYNGISALTLSEKITTPSFCMTKDGTTLYVPLFNGDAGDVIPFDGYEYTLGTFKIDNLRMAISRIIGIKVGKVCCSMFTSWYIDDNNDLYGCGSSLYGEQGIDDISGVLTFTKRASNVKDVACSEYTTWYIDNNNNLYGCGNGSYGQQGSGGTSNVKTFTKRASNVKEVVCSAYTTRDEYTTWYIDNNNNLYGCGTGSSGQQGSGGTSDVLTFTKRASNVKEVVCSEYTSWYIDNNNNLYGCGYNGSGQQGSGDKTDVLTFTKRASNVKEVSCPIYSTWYINNNNNLYGCGNGTNGQQGTGTSHGTYVLTFTVKG